MLDWIPSAPNINPFWNVYSEYETDSRNLCEIISIKHPRPHDIQSTEAMSKPGQISRTNVKTISPHFKPQRFRDFFPSTSHGRETVSHFLRTVRSAVVQIKSHTICFNSRQWSQFFIYSRSTHATHNNAYICIHLLSSIEHTTAQHPRKGALLPITR